MYYPITKSSVFRVSEQIAAIFCVEKNICKICIFGEIFMFKYDRIKLKIRIIWKNIKGKTVVLVIIRKGY